MRAIVADRSLARLMRRRAFGTMHRLAIAVGVVTRRRMARGSGCHSRRQEADGNGRGSQDFHIGPPPADLSTAPACVASGWLAVHM